MNFVFVKKKFDLSKNSKLQEHTKTFYNSSNMSVVIAIADEKICFCEFVLYYHSYLPIATIFSTSLQTVCDWFFLT